MADEEKFEMPFDISKLKDTKGKLTIICHTGDVTFDTSNHFTITHQMCMDQAEYSKANKLMMKRTEELLKKCGRHSEKNPAYPDPRKKLFEEEYPGPGFMKLMGLVEILVCVMEIGRKKGKKVPIYIETPETGLHPSQQVWIPELIIPLMKEYNYILPSKEETRPEGKWKYGKPKRTPEEDDIKT